MSAALDLAARDPDLNAWFEAHRAFQETARAALRELPPPADLADQILAARKTAHPAFRPSWLRALAGAAAALLIGAFLLFRPFPESSDRADFATFRGRMVSSILREYRMDITSTDLAAIRTFLQKHQAPADFKLTPALASLQPVGGGLLHWQGQPVSMVCLKERRLGMLYVFVAPSDTFAGPVPGDPRLESVNRLSTVSWSRDGRTYLVASAASPDELGRLF